MKSGLYVFAIAAIIVVATWAYRVNYDVQDALGRVASLRGEIAHEREALGVLRAEWAYLNRPARLRELADLNFKELQLMPLLPEHFAAPESAAYPVSPEALTIEQAILSVAPDGQFP